jgi:hypothetical protein
MAQAYFKFSPPAFGLLATGIFIPGYILGILFAQYLTLHDAEEWENKENRDRAHIQAILKERFPEDSFDEAEGSPEFYLANESLVRANRLYVDMGGELGR